MRINKKRLVETISVLGASLTIYATIHAGVSTPCHLEVFIEEKALIAVSEAPDLPALKSAWSSLPFYDLPLEAIYWTHVGELEHSADSEKALLKTIPRSPLEFAYLYALNDTKAWSSSPALVRLYEEYFESLAKAAAKHEEYIKPLLMMSRFADGEAKNSTDQANEFLKKLNLSGYLRALRRLDTQSRRSVCGDCPELAQESRKP